MVGRERKMDFSSSGSFPTWLQQPEMSQAEVRRQNPETSNLSHICVTNIQLLGPSAAFPRTLVDSWIRLSRSQVIALPMLQCWPLVIKFYGQCKKQEHNFQSLLSDPCWIIPLFSLVSQDSDAEEELYQRHWTDYLYFLSLELLILKSRSTCPKFKIPIGFYLLRELLWQKNKS